MADAELGSFHWKVCPEKNDLDTTVSSTLRHNIFSKDKVHSYHSLPEDFISTEDQQATSCQTLRRYPRPDGCHHSIQQPPKISSRAAFQYLSSLKTYATLRNQTSPC